MTLQTLEYFIAVAQYQNFTKAAQACHVTQPALSRAIRSLEEELGCTLFLRAGRRAVLTDENDVYDAVGRLRLVYPNLMRLDYDNCRTRSGAPELDQADVERDPLELFAGFYEQQNRQPLSEEQRRYLAELLETLREGRT